MNGCRKRAGVTIEVVYACLCASVLLSFTETFLAVIAGSRVPWDVAVQIFLFELAFGMVFFLFLAVLALAAVKILKTKSRQPHVAAIHLGFPVLFGFHWILETYQYNHETRTLNLFSFCLIAAITAALWAAYSLRAKSNEQQVTWRTLAYWFLFPIASMLWFSLYLSAFPDFHHFHFFYGLYAVFFVISAGMVWRRNYMTKGSEGKLSNRIIVGVAAPFAAAALLSLLSYAKTSFLERAPAYVPPKEVGKDATGPNILLISLDTLRADHLHCYGYAKETSPAIDSLARQGVRFENVISQAPSTLPSHSSLFTSQYPYELPGHRIDTHPNIPRILKDRGYTLVGFTGGHLVSRAKYGNGFDLFDDQSEGLYELRQSFALLTSVMNLRRYGRRFGISAGFLNMFNHWCFRGPNITDARASFGAQRRNASAWLSKHGHEGKFFLFLHTYSIHDYFLNKAGGRRNARLFNPGYSGVLDGVNLRYEGEYLKDEKDVNQIIALYDGEILDADREIAQLVDDLKRLDLWENTLLILLSDHGEGFDTELNRLWHGHRLTDDLLRVPLVMVFPSKIPAGRVFASQVALLDVMPTILDFLDIDCPDDIEGISLKPLITGERPGADSRRIYSQIAGWLPGDVGASVRTERHKLIKYPDRLEFYDLLADPREAENLATVESAEQSILQPLIVDFYKKGVGRPEYLEETIEAMRSLGYL